MVENCAACKQSFDRVDYAPMLFDGTWLKLAKKRETLCADCMFARSLERQIRITLADLLPCPFNRFGEPLSWFDKIHQPTNIAVRRAR